MVAMLDRPTTGSDALEAMVAVLSSRYGLVVEVAAPQRPNCAAVEIANLRDGKIRLSPGRSAEQQAFVLAHVFGHLVQHLDAPLYAALLELVESPPPIVFTPAQERAYFEFEMEASAWGEALMRACMPVSPELLQRFRGYVLTDYTTYLAYLKTGIATDAQRFQEAFTRTAATPIGPLWDCAGLVLPRSLDYAGVEISVV